MLQKVKNLLVSVKFLSLVASTWLFAAGTLSENGWIMILLSVVGFKEAGKLASAYKEIQVSNGKTKK